MLETKYEIIKENSLVVVKDGEFHFIPLPHPEIPEFLVAVIQSVLENDGIRSKLQTSSWNADNEKYVSKYANDLIQFNNGNKSDSMP
jgi:hypothetical protein